MGEIVNSSSGHRLNVRLSPFVKARVNHLSENLGIDKQNVGKLAIMTVLCSQEAVFASDRERLAGEITMFLKLGRWRVDGTIKLMEICK